MLGRVWRTIHSKFAVPIFTAHAIRLADGSNTKPESDWDMSRHPVLIASLSVLKEQLGSDLRGKSIADIGCLEGGYTVEFARVGMKALGIDVRESNIRACNYVQNLLKLENLSFIRDDARNLSRYGKFDAVFCCGLLYHLSEPFEFLHLLADATDLLLLDTHYSIEENADVHALGPMDEHEGFKGRWYTEFHEGDDTRNDGARWSSWENMRSFWPLRDELFRAVEKAGFTILQVIERSEQRLFLAAKKR